MTEQERYLFDVQGYLVVENALNRDQITALDEIRQRDLLEPPKSRRVTCQAR